MSSTGKMRHCIPGTAPENLPLSCEDVPKLDNLMQQGSRESSSTFSSSDGKQRKFVQRLKISVDPAGNADIKNYLGVDTCTIISLFKLWLDELPHINSILRALVVKHERKGVYDLNAEFCNDVMKYSKVSLNIERAAVELLTNKFVRKRRTASYDIDQLPEMLAKILIGCMNVEHVDVRDFCEIFNERSIPRTFKLHIERRKKRNYFINLKDDRHECELPLSINKLPGEDKSNCSDVGIQNGTSYRISCYEDLSDDSNDYSRRQLHNLHTDKEFESLESDVLLAPQPLYYHGDSRIQEEIRKAERFNPQFRNNSRRKCNYLGYGMKTRVRGESTRLQDVDAIFENSPSSSLFSELNSVSYDYKNKQEHSVQCPDDYEEQITRKHIRNWSIANSQNWFTSDRESPSLATSTTTHFTNLDSKILFAWKHLQRVKKKMKDNGDVLGKGPTIANGVSHSEYKRMAATIVFLKNYLKRWRDETTDSLVPINNFDTFSATSRTGANRWSLEKDTKETLENLLYEEYVVLERSGDTDLGGYEKLESEKISFQKEILNSENIFCKTMVENEEELLRILYDEHYGTAKGLPARSITNSLKFQENVSSDLSTIDENETMDFRICPVSTNFTVCNVSRNDFPINNICDLSFHELRLEYKTTKKEKKKLRNRIRVCEQEVKNSTTTNQCKPCIHSLCYRYKNTKAKLKLLEALLMKTSINI